MSDGRGKRKHGHSKLVFDKAAQTIVTVATSAPARDYAALGRFAESTGKFKWGTVCGVEQWVSEPPLDMVRNSVLEEAALVADAFTVDECCEPFGLPEFLDGYDRAAEKIAAAIRALKDGK